MWHLTGASLRLGKELGNAPWMHKTLWPEGWLPIDTYEKRVDELVTVGNKRDWEHRRKQIIENGGIRNSVLSSFMPGESSTIGAGTTNSVYPIRDLYIMKTNDTMANHWAAPDGTKLKNKYQSAWDVSTSDMIKVYSIIQKWTDQAISADLFVQIQGADKVSSSQMIQDYLDMVKYGMKTRYYVNSLTSKGVDLTTEETAIQVGEASANEQPGICESCSL
jgi:ribonucleoside-diphosphate reductase alpha chain